MTRIYAVYSDADIEKFERHLTDIMQTKLTDYAR